MCPRMKIVLITFKLEKFPFWFCWIYYQRGLRYVKADILPKLTTLGRTDQFTSLFHKSYLPTMINEITWSIGFSNYLPGKLRFMEIKSFPILTLEKILKRPWQIITRINSILIKIFDLINLSLSFLTSSLPKLFLIMN